MANLACGGKLQWRFSIRLSFGRGSRWLFMIGQSAWGILGASASINAVGTADCALSHDCTTPEITALFPAWYNLPSHSGGVTCGFGPFRRYGVSALRKRITIAKSRVHFREMTDQTHLGDRCAPIPAAHDLRSFSDPIPAWRELIQISIADGSVPFSTSARNQFGWRPFPVQVCVLSAGFAYFGLDGFAGFFAAFAAFGAGLRSSFNSLREKPNSAAAFSAALRASRRSRAAAAANAFLTSANSFSNSLRVKDFRSCFIILGSSIT